MAARPHTNFCITKAIDCQLIVVASVWFVLTLNASPLSSQRRETQQYTYQNVPWRLNQTFQIINGLKIHFRTSYELQNQHILIRGLWNVQNCHANLIWYSCWWFDVRSFQFPLFPIFWGALWGYGLDRHWERTLTKCSDLVPVDSDGCGAANWIDYTRALHWTDTQKRLYAKEAFIVLLPSCVANIYCCLTFLFFQRFMLFLFISSLTYLTLGGVRLRALEGSLQVRGACECEILAKIKCLAAFHATAHRHWSPSKMYGRQHWLTFGVFFRLLLLCLFHSQRKLKFAK